MQTKPTSHPVLRNLIFGLLLLTGLVTLLMSAPSSGAVAFAAAGDDPGDPVEASGAIEALPESDGLLGVWTIDGVDYDVTPETRLGPDLTVYAVGKCVEVKYNAETDPYTAYKIEHDSDCDGEGDGGDDERPGDPDEASGSIEALPAGDDLVGVWTIDGVNYDVIAETRLGPDLTVYAVGECVEVKYDAEIEPYTAYKIEHDSDCDGEGDGGDDDRPGDPDEASGEIEVLPESGDLIGVWTVDGVDYDVTPETRLGPDLTVYAVGECVEVKYNAETEPYTAYKIEHDSDCDGEGDRGDDERPGDPDEASGEIEVLPASDDLVGVWTIDGVNYDVIAETRLGPDLTVYAVGKCVEVKYDAETDPFTARKVELDDDCNGEGDDGQHGDDAEFKGPIESLPETDGLIGVWTVRGMEFAVTAETELEAEYGPFAVGVCVEIKYDDSTTPYTAVEIEGKRTHACHGGGDDGGDDDHDGEGELYGVLQAFPAELIGEWQIGGWAFVADAETEFDQARGAFEVGGLVKVEFYVTSDGVNHAKEIKVKDDRGDDHHDGHDGNAFGPIESFPAELVGDWVIGGLSYRANNETRFEQEHGEFAVDAWVKVRYYVDESGDRIAVKIETEDDHAGGQAPDLSKFVGFVDSMPATGFVGNWVVGGETFVTGPQTRFEEAHVALAVGAYVELEYRLVDGVNKVHEMQTEVPPDAGDANAVGEIESMDDGAAAAGLNATSTWRIGGQAYTITDATRLNDDQGALAVGATALVNSYTAADGSQVATSVTGVEINYRVFLPVMSSQ